MSMFPFKLPNNVNVSLNDKNTIHKIIKILKITLKKKQFIFLKKIKFKKKMKKRKKEKPTYFIFLKFF
jgi:hypothetical protein